MRRFLAEQFPEWSELALSRVEPMGTDNAIFRLGDELTLRLARRKGPTEPGGKEFDWLPRLAPLLPVEIPVPLAQGPARMPNIPGSGTSTAGLRARRFRSRRSMRSGPRATSRR